MKKLGFGLMRLPLLDKNDNGSIDIETTKKMVDTFIERGFTYFDTAWMYCNFNSERAIKEALVDRYPRDSYTLATKLHSAFFNTTEERDNVFEEQLKKTGAGYFDYYLIHAIGEENYGKYTELDCFNFVAEKKRQGLVKHMGFSFHDTAEVLDKVLSEHPEMEFVQLQINYLDWENERIQSRLCYETALKHGKKVVIMEPVKGGTLANVPEEVDALFKSQDEKASAASWAIRFCASLDNVMVVLSGMSNMEQLLDNTGYMQDFETLTDSEMEMVKKAGELISTHIEIPCTACEYCLKGCPMNIAIPKYFDLYNISKQGKGGAMSGYRTLAETFGKASECVECGACASVCPQHLDIPELLKKVAKRLER